jgi:hypothetical protein
VNDATIKAPATPDMTGATKLRLRGPPRLPFAFSIGVTGHRLEALSREVLPQLEERLGAALALLRKTAEGIYEAEKCSYSAEQPRFLFVSPLADGVDQIAAETALELGFELVAILPFAREGYLATFPDEGSRACFVRLLDKASCVLELPGELDHQLDAYVMAGRATVAHCDLLLAVWDGLPPRGRGGTGEVVDLALTRGTPLVHLPVTADGPATLRWSAFDPAVLTRKAGSQTQRPFDEAQLQKLLTALLAPPPDPRERAFLNAFQNERNRRWRSRLEYPLLLAIAGIAPLGRKDWHSQHCSVVTRAEWEAYRQQCCDPHGVDAPVAPIEPWYEWSDRLASHFGQSYRSGHVFNFIFGAIAVLTALSALIEPHLKSYLASAEFAFILAILINTRVGVRYEWHRRWLDYRQLAERLRPMRSLKLLGIAAPDPPGSATHPIAGRWVDWYATAVWRAAGCPHGQIDAASISSLARAIGCHEIRPQIDYNRSIASQVHRLDHRLERIGTATFAASLISCIVLVIWLRVDPEWVAQNFKWFTIASAGLPAIATAIFGIRVQGDFSGTAVRSETTAEVLQQIAEELEAPEFGLGRCADLVEESARAMLADLDKWRLINEQHDLSV